MARLFVSYARRDGAALALRLVEDLARAGHEPWLDRAEIQGGEAWSREIDDAIAGCEALLAVMTAGSYDSGMCRGEQVTALNHGKRVLPLKAQADARVPFYLNATQWIDFCDAAQYEVRLAELIDAIAQARGVGPEHLTARQREQLQSIGAQAAAAAPAAGALPDWDALLQRAATQRARYLGALAGRARQPGVYEAALWVDRPAELAELERFGAADAAALVIVGDPGVGKTSLLAHWVEARAAAGDVVLAYAADRVDAQRFDAEVARDLGVEGTDALAGAWGAIDAAAAAAGRRVWVLVDGLNDARGSGEPARLLLESVDRLVGDLPGAAVKFVLSCSLAGWQRMDRRAPLNLTWARYHRTRDEADALLVDRFTDTQAASAFERHAQRFGLSIGLADLPPAFRTRLREPMLLRLLADALQGGAPVPEGADFDALVFQRYHDRHVRSAADRAFVDELAAQMLAQRSATLALQPLLAHPVLGAALRDEAPDGVYGRLLDDGVLTEVRGNLFDDDRVRFTYPQVGAYALVRVMLRRAEPPATLACELATMADALPLAWEAAVTLLVLRGDARALEALAADTDPELRELALEALVRLHAADAAKTRALLDDLVDRGTPEQQRVALRAAFQIGPAARELLVHGALSDSARLRNAVRDTLYLIWSGVSRAAGETRSSALYFVWRHAPDFTHELMRELAGRLSWLHPADARRILAFVLDLSITIYVNHCEREDVRGNTAALFRELTVERLQLDRIELGATLERIVFRVVAAVFADRLLRWMMLDEDETAPKSFFGLDAQRRAPLRAAAALLDPAADLGAAQALLQQLLASDIGVLRGAGALVLAVHATARFDAAQPVLRALFDALDSRGRLWLLASLSVLLPQTPPQWLPLLEELTARLAGEPAPAPPLLPFLDALYLPLALAAAKAGATSPLVQAALAGAAADPARACRAIAALGVVGFYHPRAALAALQLHAKALLEALSTQAAMVGALATMRTLHFDPVDQLLADAGAPDSLRRDIVAGADPDRVQKFMRLLGYYNNAVHYCVHFPRMRRGLAERALLLLAEADDAGDFITGYATQAIAMAREARFDLLRWTLPDGADGTG